MATNKHIIDIQTKGATKSKREIQGITGSLGKMATRAAGAAAAFYAAKGLIQGMTDLARQASEVQRLERGFDNLGKQIGFNSQSFTKLDKAVNGTMKQVDLMTKANNAMFLGIVKSDDEMAQLFDTAQRLGQALGLDTAQAIDSIVTGMGRQSKLMLDNLGIMIDTNKAYEDYALTLNTTASALTESQKKQAFNNAVLEESQRLVKGLGPEVLDTAVNFEQFSVAVNDLTLAIGERLAPTFAPLLKILTTAANSAADFISGITDTPLERTIKELDALGASAETLIRLENIQIDKQLRLANEELGFLNKQNLTTKDIENNLNNISQNRIDLLDELATLQLSTTDEELQAIQNQENAIEKRYARQLDLMQISEEVREGGFEKDKKRLNIIQQGEQVLSDFRLENEKKIQDLQTESEIEKTRKEQIQENLVALDQEEEKLAQIAIQQAEVNKLELQKVDLNNITKEQNEEELSAKDLFIQKLGAELSLKQQQIDWTDEFIEKNKELARSMGLVNSTTAEREKLARQDVANLQMVGAEFKEFQGIAKASAIAMTTYDTYKSASSLFKKYAEAYPPPAGEILGGISAALAVGAGLARVQQIKKAQYGADFVTDGPQMMMVGEGSGPERVQVTPLQDPNIDGPQAQGMTINVQGSVIGTEEFTENTLLPQIREGIRLGEQI